MGPDPDGLVRLPGFAAWLDRDGEFAQRLRQRTLRLRRQKRLQQHLLAAGAAGAGAGGGPAAGRAVGEVRSGSGGADADATADDGNDEYTEDGGLSFGMLSRTWTTSSAANSLTATEVFDSLDPTGRGALGQVRARPGKRGGAGSGLGDHGDGR